MPRNLRSSIIFSLLFCFIFPWSLAAEVSRKAPQNSLTYFLETDQQETQTPEVVSPPEQPEPAQPVSIDSARTPADETVRSTPPFDRNAAIDAMRARLAEQTAVTTENNEPARESAKEAANKPEVAPEPEVSATIAATAEQKPVEPAGKKAEIRQPIEATAAAPASEPAKIVSTPVPQPEQIQTAADDYVPFSGALAKMQQNRDKRAAEAAKLGVVLPSQGGDIATVSPSLSKMQQAIRAIMSR